MPDNVKEHYAYPTLTHSKPPIMKYDGTPLISKGSMRH